jgi:class 3 adenylate cyclase/tetratricopeptide (TPR) repeat protein
MQCPRCQAENRVGRRFCGECGLSLALTCPACGFLNEGGERFCGGCGAPMMPGPAVPRPSPSPQSHTPKHLAERILTTKAALEGERKHVTVLFADLKGSMELLADRDPEEARKILDPVLELMMEAVHRYEGTVNQVMGDGIMALFGAPLAHEDHAVRACYAALRMQESVKRYAEEVHRMAGVPLHIRVGLNSGEVVVRSIGSDLHMDYTAVGQTTHVAARLEQMAMPGSVLISSATLELTEGYVAVSALGPRPIKGLERPIEVFEVTAPGRARSRLQVAVARGLSRLVGRDAEVEQLRRAVEKAAQGHGQVAAVVGEPGIGKSRLIYEVIHSHRTHGWLVLGSASVSYGKATSFWPVIDLLKAYFRIETDDDPRKIREKVTGKLLTLDRAFEPTVPAFLGVLEVAVDDGNWKTLDPPQRYQRTLDAIKRLLIRESQVQPVLLVFEDLHWVDSETQVLLDSLVEGLPTARLLLLVNYRPGYQHTWGTKSYYTQLRLDPLPPENADALLKTLLGHDASLQRLTQCLIQQTDGNPFFLEESVRTLVETKALTGEPGGYRLAKSIETIEVPATVQAVLAARIDRLPPEDKRLLQSAAVIGHEVPFPLLEAVAGENDEQLRRQLARLQAAEFLYETPRFPDPEYTFRHALTLEVAYQSLLRERRCSLHKRVLEELERQSAGRDEDIELRAHHARRAELWDRAARYLYQAGEKAFAEARYPACVTSCQATIEALDRLGDGADRSLKLDACLELWSARSTTGQFEGLRELGEKAEALARALEDQPRLAQVQLRQAQAVGLMGVIPGTFESAIEKARQAFEGADPSDLRTRSYARFIVGNAFRDLGRFAEALREFSAGLALFEQVDRNAKEPGVLLPIYVSLSAWRSEAHAALGDFQQAFISAREALRVATEIRHPTSLAVANRYLGYVHSLRGEMETALPFLERAVAVASEYELFQATIFSSAYLGYALILLGERKRGLECLTRAVAKSTWPIRANWNGFGSVIASAYFAAGCLEEARTEIRQGLTAATERNARGHRASLLRLEAEVLGQQDSADAQERLEEALALAVELGMRLEAAHCYLGLGKLSQRKGKREQARANLATAKTMYRDMGMTYWLEKVDAELAELG